MGLRALLIQKDVKHTSTVHYSFTSLRALLIQKDVKPGIIRVSPGRFESFVNSERCKTDLALLNVDIVFESFVNSERCKTWNRNRSQCRRV